MPGLSFERGKKGRPIAIVKGGDMNDELLYLHDDSDLGGRSGRGHGRSEIPAHKYQAQLKRWKKHEQAALLVKFQEALDSSKELDEDESEEAKELFKRIKEDRATQTEVELPHDSMFSLIPNPDPKKRDVYYIVGSSGSGKSHIARGIAEGYRYLYPDRPIILVSKLNEDDTLDNMKGGKPLRLNIQTLVDDPPDIEEFRDSLVIIDDVDALPKKQLDAVRTLANDISITGRHTVTSLLWLSHHITDYSRTRLILNEATCYVVYPQTTSRHALKYLLETHAGIDSENIKKLRKMGRWVAVHKNCPVYVIGAHEAMISNLD